MNEEKLNEILEIATQNFMLQSRPVWKKQVKAAIQALFEDSLREAQHLHEFDEDNDYRCVQCGLTVRQLQLNRKEP